MGRPSNTTQRRGQIIKAFVKVVAKQGYDGATISEIAQKAGLAQGLVHYHFKNKLEILLAALELITAEHQARLDVRLAACAEDPSAEVAAFIDVHLGLGAHSSPDALGCWVIIGAEAIRQKEVRQAFEAALEAMAERLRLIIERGIKARSFDCDDAGAAAAALLATIEGYFVVAGSARAIIPSGSAARSTVAMAEGLLKPSKRLRLPKVSS